MIGRRTYKGRATVGQSSYMGGKVGFDCGAVLLKL